MDWKSIRTELISASEMYLSRNDPNFFCCQMTPTRTEFVRLMVPGACLAEICGSNVSFLKKCFAFFPHFHTKPSLRKIHERVTTIQGQTSIFFGSEQLVDQILVFAPENEQIDVVSCHACFGIRISGGRFTTTKLSSFVIIFSQVILSSMCAPAPSHAEQKSCVHLKELLNFSQTVFTKICLGSQPKACNHRVEIIQTLHSCTSLVFSAFSSFLLLQNVYPALRLLAIRALLNPRQLPHITHAFCSSHP